jgi:hypothetical protein
VDAVREMLGGVDTGGRHSDTGGRGDGRPAGDRGSSLRWRLRLDRKAPASRALRANEWCRRNRCEVQLRGVSRVYGMCLKCGRHWGSHPAGDGTSLSELRGRVFLGFSTGARVPEG